MKTKFLLSAKTRNKLTSHCIGTIVFSLIIAPTSAQAEVPDPDFFDGSIHSEQHASVDSSNRENGSATPSSAEKNSGQTKDDATAQNSGQPSNGSAANGNFPDQAGTGRVFEDFKIGGNNSNKIPIPQSKPDANKTPETPSRNENSSEKPSESSNNNNNNNNNNNSATPNNSSGSKNNKTPGQDPSKEIPSGL